ncbi:CamS family sex pheromone protein [Bacillus sp. 165]|uniref:CamS family sex pheromone protein n=1 Tax=Bacillus sp. 165 TaxID=1529117 RepID=UPI001ADCB772|nr:CamS family sex pheromone protein [Bacillus sp. 165]MBO9131261.1 CamS family sex pheromone protein [Bacillus sp. 165]
MKKVMLVCISLGLLLSGCGQNLQKEDKVVQENTKSKDNAIIPKYSISEDYYKSIIPFKPGKARGLVVQGLNSRLDMAEYEMGLMRVAKNSFSPKDYLFQEGQYLDRDTVQKMLARKRTAEEQAEVEQKAGDKEVPDMGLNPPFDKTAPGTLEEKNAKSPIYISNILEHNYLRKKEDNKVELGGIVIGLAMNSVHYFTQEKGYSRQYEITKEEILTQGKAMAQKILAELRKQKDLKNVPIIFAIYRQEAKSSLVPGHFLTYATSDKGSTSIGDWHSVDEEYYLFPSKKVTENYREDATKVLNFKSDISEYFENDYVGVIGRGFYKDGQLRELKLDIPIKFNGEAEIIGFTQYVTGLIMEHFPSYIKVEAYINSINKQEAVIIRDVDQEKPFVHIFE